jgi:hypothetical protein
MKLGSTALPQVSCLRLRSPQREAASSSYALVANSSFFRLRNKLTNPQMTNS